MPGQYSIVEEGPQDSTLGAWAPVSIVCNGTSTDPTSSDVLVTLTPADPQVTCAFTNTFTPVAQAPASSTTVPEPRGPGHRTGPGLHRHRHPTVPWPWPWPWPWPGRSSSSSTASGAPAGRWPPRVDDETPD